MRANNPNLSLEVGPFVLACGVCIALFSFLTIRCMAGRDVTTGITASAPLIQRGACTL